MKITARVLVILLTLLMTILLVLQIPAAQTALVRRVLASLEKNIDGRLEFADMTFVPFNGLVIKDLAIIDPDLEWEVIPQELHSKSKNSVFKGERLRGRNLYTICRGKVVYSL